MYGLQSIKARKLTVTPSSRVAFMPTRLLSSMVQACIVDEWPAQQLHLVHSHELTEWCHSALRRWVFPRCEVCGHASTPLAEHIPMVSSKLSEGAIVDVKTIGLASYSAAYVVQHEQALSFDLSSMQYASIHGTKIPAFQLSLCAPIVTLLPMIVGKALSCALCLATCTTTLS